MFKAKDLLTILIISLILGYVLAQQFYLQQKVKKVTQSDSSASLAMEVSELIKNNNKLKKEKIGTDEELNKLTQSAESSQQTSETIQENLNNFKIILGVVPVSGKGVIISLDQEVESVQIIDLINAIKNIGAEAISINNKRIGPTSSIENGVFYPPTLVQIIGDQNLLYDSLTRSGGIIDQIEAGKVEKQDSISLNAI